MGSNTEYIYGTPTVGILESTGKSVIDYPNAIKIVGYPESGEINIGILPVDEDGNMQEVSDESMWTRLDEASAATFIRLFQKQAKRTFGSRPW
jgi:hypothetical protein